METIIHVVAKKKGGWVVVVRHSFPTGLGVCIWQRAARTVPEVKKHLEAAVKVRRDELKRLGGR